MSNVDFSKQSRNSSANYDTTNKLELHLFTPFRKSNSVFHAHFAFLAISLTSDKENCRV